MFLRYDVTVWCNKINIKTETCRMQLSRSNKAERRVIPKKLLLVYLHTNMQLARDGLFTRQFSCYCVLTEQAC